MTSILGISAYYHDSAACLVVDGEVVAAAQEERFTRRKNDAGFPDQAVAFCLRQAGLSPRQLDLVGFYDKPFIKFERILANAVWAAPRGFGGFVQAMPLWLHEKLRTRALMRQHLPGYDGPLLFPEHHVSHAASAFFPSPFERAAIMTLDGVGEWATTTQGVGAGNSFSLDRELRYPHSLGLLYSAFTYYCGFKVNSGEYKLMGLAPYGRPVHADTIRRRLVDVKPDGSFKLNMDYFGFGDELRMTNDRFHGLFGGPPKAPDTLLTQREADLAASVQLVLEDIVLAMARDLHRRTSERFLCLAGGCALNCVSNARLVREGPFEDVWIQPAAGDAGGALGVALYLWHVHHRQPRRVHGGRDRMGGAYLGPEWSDGQLAHFIELHGLPAQLVGYADVPAETARLIERQKVVGWFQGRMEFGPRALGARSILGDARAPEMQSVMNLKIKFRESFRPFAPSVLAEKAAQWFDLDRESPYMLLTAPVRSDRRTPIAAADREVAGIDRVKVARSQIPAVTHVDYSARVQTVNRRDNPLYYDAIAAFERATGCPVVINTSFNVRGEPIVCSPVDAYRCFMRSNVDALVLGPYVLFKEDQPSAGGIQFDQTFERD